MPDSSFAERMRDRMNRKRMRVTDLAKETGLPQPRISTYVTGKRKPSYETIIALSRALDWPLDDALEAAGRHSADMEGSATGGSHRMLELPPVVERLQPEQRSTLYAMLRDMAHTWASSVVEVGYGGRDEKGEYYKLLTSPFLPSAGTVFGRVKFGAVCPTIAA